MIQIQDLSETTINIYNQCKLGDIAISDLLDILLTSDFSKSELKQFVKKEFPKSLYSYLSNYIDKN